MVMKKGLGDKVMSFFVVREDDEDERATAEADVPVSIEPEPEAVAAPRASAPARAAQAGLAGAPLVPPGKAHDAATFRGVYRAAGVGDDSQEKVEKVLTLLASLPASTPIDVRRTIVEASLKAFGFDIAKIVAAANNQLKALDTYVRLNEQQTAKSITDAQAQIAQLEDKVISLRADITKRTEQLASVSAAADNRKGQVHQVLQFFAASAPAAAPKP